MKLTLKQKTATVATVAIVSIVAACGANNNNAAPQTPQADPLEQAFNENPPTEMCGYYATLVNMGWNNETIYSEMKAGGAFDNFVGDSGHTFFNALVKWCYNN